jgi:Fur family transcriptional regulator, ferric uptake regulator
VDEILQLAGTDVPQLNLATVYRNLKLLIEENKIVTVDLPGDNTRYERVDLIHHHHFLCHQCDRLFDVKGCPEGISAIVPSGFRLISHTITLTGYCLECNKDTQLLTI